MPDACYLNLLRDAGFALIGRIDYRLSLTAWWNPAHRVQVLLLELGESVLIKADKTYYLQSVSEQGETWARDIPQLHDYLEHHFPEVRIAFSHFRDVPEPLAEREARRRMTLDAPTLPLPSVEQIAQLQRQLQSIRHAAQSAETHRSYFDDQPDLLSGYLHQQVRHQHSNIQQLEAELQRKQQRLDLLHQLQHEYQRKGSAAVYSFNIHSSLHIVVDAHGFSDALAAVVKDVQDQHRYHVTQKLQGGRLNIQIAEIDEPAIAWIEQWFGGTLSPTQIERLGLHGRAAVPQDQVIVTPDEPIQVDGYVRAAEKRLGARVLSTFVSRLDKTGAHPRETEEVSAAALPLRIGVKVDNAGRDLGPAVLPLTQVVHMALSGTTGSGKSFAARVLIEEAAMVDGLNILILDPRNQCAGLLVPEDRPEVIQHYARHGMEPEGARAFAFDYVPAETHADQQGKHWGHGRKIISFKSLNDHDRCRRAAAILTDAFEARVQQEADRPQLLIVIDEAHLLTRKRVEEEAKEAASKVELAIDRIVREGRKYGVVLVLVSQSMRDFSHDLASVRQMTATKIFLRNADREIEYAASFLGDARPLIHLRNGEALIHNAAWGVQRVVFRPPWSKVQEIDGNILRENLNAPNAVPFQPLGLEARRLYDMVLSHAHSPLNLSQLAQIAGLTSRRKLQDLIGELEQAGLIHTRQLAERGKPRLVELTTKSESDLRSDGAVGKKAVHTQSGAGDEPIVLR